MNVKTQEDMMSVANGDVIRVTAKLLGPQGQQVQNVFYYKYVGSADDDDVIMHAVADHLEANVYTPINPYIDHNCSYDTISYYNVTNSTPMGDYAWPTLNNGGDVTYAALPSGVAMLLTAATAVKKVRPKKYFGISTEAAVEEGSWTASALTAMATAAAGWITEVVSILGTLTPGTWRRVAATFSPLLTATVRSIASYQRRRKPGAGA